MSEPLDILAIAAHPDDAEVGCGGTLILASDAGLRVGVADLTAGERASRGNRERRGEERDRATDLMGLSVRRSLGLPDTAVGTDLHHRDAVIHLLRDLRPAVVLAPYHHDRHPDHAAAGRLVQEAAFLAGVRALGEGDPHRPARLYHFMVHQPFTPSFVVDISAVWARKLAAMRAYESQFGSLPGDRPTELAEGSFLELAEAGARFHGAMIGAGYGEPFHCAGPVPLEFLPGFHDVGAGEPRRYRMFP